MSNPVELVVPSIGESVSEGTIGTWHFQEGDWVEKGDVVFELESDKATMEINAPVAGVLKVLAQEGDTVAVGSAVATLDPEAEGAAPKAKGSNGGGDSSEKTAPTPVAAEAPKASGQTQGKGPTTHWGDTSSKGLGPRNRKALREGKATNVSTPTGLQTLGTAGIDLQKIPAVTTNKKIPLIRRRIAERLMESQKNTATLTTFNEVDLTNVMAIRSSLKDQFMSTFNAKLGFMSFFSKAVSYALQEVPGVNGYIDGEEVVLHNNVHLSIAVSTERGLVVPVLRWVDQLSYADVELGIAKLATSARDGKLGLDEMQGGSFTITNGGVFGSLISTPILNPPQSAILGMHKIEHRPMALKNPETGKFEVVVRPMMYLAMSYDHRLIDGKESVTCLVKVKEYLEEIVTADEVMGRV